MEWSYFWSQWFTGSSPWTVMLCRVLTFYQILFYTFTCTSGMYYWCCFMVCTQVQFLLEYFIPLWMVLFWLAISTNTIQQYMYIARGVIFFHHQHRQQECSCELLIELVSSPLCNETPAIGCPLSHVWKQLSIWYNIFCAYLIISLSIAVFPLYLTVKAITVICM